MQKNLVAFIIKLSAYAFIIWLIYFFANSFIPAKLYFHKAPYLILFYFLVTLVFHAGLLNSERKSNRSLVTYYMLATALKLFIYLGIIIGFGLLKTGKSIPFISNFLMLYILFTIFEVAVVYSHFKTKIPAQSVSDSDRLPE